MSLYETLLLLHLLAAFALVAGVAAFGVLVLGDGDRAVRRALVVPAIALWNAGGLGVIVFGVALAIQVDAYQPWDGWIIAAIVLWFIASGVGGPLSRGMRDESANLPAQRARLLLGIMALATLAILVDMIVKPGA